eukprot:gb/GFBE01057974.1/.p1 GENE.gb/GFBE01057974.1/~~gb/GFBE01057974.1/.p1  ORF type:complete len:422 (+),score=70.91 gb/GFBE01057974.1/:1-1266(+)
MNEDIPLVDHESGLCSARSVVATHDHDPEPMLRKLRGMTVDRWSRLLMVVVGMAVATAGAVVYSQRSLRSPGARLPNMPALLELATSAHWDPQAIDALQGARPTAEDIRQLSAIPLQPTRHHNMSQLGLIHDFAQTSAHNSGPQSVSKLESLPDAELAVQRKMHEVLAVITNASASTEDRDWAVAACVFSVMLSAYNVPEMAFEIGNVVYACESTDTEAKRHACAANVGKLIVTLSAAGLNVAASVATCKPEGNTKADCAYSIFDMTAALGAWSAAPSALIIGCNTEPHFVDKSPESSWTNLGECLVGAGEVPPWLGRAIFFFRAASVSCPGDSQLEKNLCLQHVSQALAHLAVGAYYLAMAVTTCGPKLDNDGVCAQGAIAVAAATNAMITGATGVSLFCCEPGSRETCAAKDDNDVVFG